MNGWCCGRGGRRANRLGTRANSPFYPRNNDETSFFLFLVKIFLIFSQKGIFSVLSLFYFMWYMLEKPDVPGGGAHCVHLSDGWLSGTLSQNIWKKLNFSKYRGFQLIQQLGLGGLIFTFEGSCEWEQCFAWLDDLLFCLLASSDAGWSRWSWSVEMLIDIWHAYDWNRNVTLIKFVSRITNWVLQSRRER